MKNKFLNTSLAAITSVMLIAGSNAATAEEKTLYQRLGGYDAITAVTRDLAARLMADPKLKRFWAYRGKDGIEREVQLIVDYLSAKSGGPLYYRGREMKLSHVGMKIDEEDWQAMMKHVFATAKKFKIPAREAKELVTFLESTKKDIVEVK